MATISRQTTWSDGQTLTASALNGEFNNIVNDYNGGITDANIAAGAAIAGTKLGTGIVESKVTFSGSGHGHTGGTDGKVITKIVSYGGAIPGSLIVGNDLSWNPRVRSTTTATTISAHVKTAPTGSSLTVQVYDITQSRVVASISITAGNTDASSSSMTNASLTTGDILRFDVTAVGSTVAGSDLTLQLDCTE